MNTALITGCSSGIGKAIAEFLMFHGWKVYATARDMSSLEELRKNGAIPLQLDVTRPDSIAKAMMVIKANSGKLDALINNAGFGLFGVFEYVDEGKARQQFDVNVFGLASVTKAALPLLRESSEGRIINLSSIAGKVSLPFGAWYCASKFAVEALSDSLRIELSSQNIKVVSIQPGPIDSNFGTTMRQNMVIPKADGVYDTVVQKAMNYLKGDFDKSPNGKGIDVAKIVHKALTAKHPKARYRVTRVAKMLALAKNILPARTLDKLFIKKLGLNDN